MFRATACGASAKSRAISRAVFQMPLGIGLQFPADGIERRAIADGGEHILQRAPRRIMHQHIVGCEQRQVEASRERDALGECLAHVRAIGHACGEPDPAGCGVARRVETLCCSEPI